MQRTLGHTLFIALLLGFVAAAGATYTLWEHDHGMAVRQAAHVDWRPRGVAADDNGNMLVAWADARNGAVHIFAQLYDIDGLAQWQEGGIQLSNDVRSERRPVIRYLGDGEWAIAWYTFFCGLGACGVSEVVVQKIDSDGNALWGEGGLNLVEELAIETSLELMPAADGGVFVTWRNDYLLRGQRISADGQRQWGAEGIALNTDLVSGFAVGTNAAGDALYVARSVNVDGSQRVLLERYNSDGEAQWNDGDGLAVASAPGDQANPVLTWDAGGGVYVLWYFYTDAFQGIHGQRVDSSGQTLWNEQGVQLAWQQEVNAYDNLHALPASDGFFFGWTRYGESPQDWILSVQHITETDGAPVLNWGAPNMELMGAQAAQESANYFAFNMRHDDDNGLLLAWNATLPAGQPLVGFQRVNANGETAWNSAVTQHPSATYQPEYNDVIAAGDRVVQALFEREPGDGALRLLAYDPATGLPDEDGDILVVDGTYGNASDARLIRSGDAVLSAWLDRRDLLSGVIPYIQSIDPETGHGIWDEAARLINGLRVTEEGDTLFMTAESLSVTPDGQGGAGLRGEGCDLGLSLRN